MSAISTYRANCCCTYRWLARTSAIVLAATWLAAVVWEGTPDNGMALPLYVQLGLLAVIFGGYAISFRRERLGAVLSLAGIVAFAVASLLTLQVLPTLPFVMFALPPVLFLVAWELEKKHAVVESLQS